MNLSTADILDLRSRGFTDEQIAKEAETIPEMIYLKIVEYERRVDQGYTELVEVRDGRNDIIIGNLTLRHITGLLKLNKSVRAVARMALISEKELMNTLENINKERVKVL